MNIKYGVVSIVLFLIGLIILFLEIKRKPVFDNMFDKFLYLIRMFFAGENISFAVLLICTGLLFLLASLRFI